MTFKASDQPFLILFNGAPAVGKSTIASLFSQEHLGSLLIDLDVWREFLAGGDEIVSQKGSWIREISLSAIETQLGINKKSVVLAQLVANVEYLEKLAAICERTGSRFIEFILEGDKEAIKARFIERGGSKVEISEISDSFDFDNLWSRLEDLKEARSTMISIQVDGKPEDTLRAINSHLSNS